MLLATLEKSQKKEDLMVLCPLDKEHNKFLNRWCYSELLKETLDVYDTMDYPIDVFDGKRIIHFKKMPLKDAIDICEKIITEEPSVYPQLTKILNKLKVNEYA